MKKGQTGVMDLIIAVVIAIIALTAIALSWDRFIIKLNEKNEFNDLQIKLFQISDQLVTSEGNPDEWNENVSKLTSLGLAIEDRVLSMEKVHNLSKLNEGQNTTNIKKLLNIEAYEIFVNVSYLNGPQISILGPEPYQNKSVVSFIRYPKDQLGRALEVNVKLWKK